MRKRSAALLFVHAFSPVFSSHYFSYSEINQGYASFDISMPIDATGYTLHGSNLKGGSIQFTDRGQLILDSLAYETGDFELPTSTDIHGKPLIKTKICYQAIKFLCPGGIQNLFIKIGQAIRTEEVSGLDPYVLKDGTYTWNVPIFSFGKEKNDIAKKSENLQFMQVGTGEGSPSQHNGMYTQQFCLYTKGNGSHAIAGHPQKTFEKTAVLAKAYTSHFICHADGIWGAGGSDPYRTITGRCEGESITFPAGPHLDYEYGSFTLPTVHTPWTAAPSDHCEVKGKKHAGCVNASIASSFHYSARKIRVPIHPLLTLYAEFGSAYRSIEPQNLRYQCKDNVYLKDLVPQSDCLIKDYLPGGSEYPYFAVGYEFKTKEGKNFSARYIYIPEQENGNRLAWLDASASRIYALSVNDETISQAEMKRQFVEMLEEISQIPQLNDVLGKTFFLEILKKNNLY